MKTTAIPEWHPQQACWVGWPYLEHEWGPVLREAQREWLALVQAIGSFAEDLVLKVLVPKHPAASTVVREALGEVSWPGTPPQFVAANYGDAWLRDTTPLFVREGGKLGTRLLEFNGWGGKYVMPGDKEVAAHVSADSLARCPGTQHRSALVGEGGGLEVNGRGTLISTEEVLLNPNRNPGWGKHQVEAELARLLGVSRFLWIPKGIPTDHTDGHVDNIARFVCDDLVAITWDEKRDPYRETHKAVREALTRASTLSAVPLRFLEIPSPGTITGREGHLLPASYCNFLISNGAVFVPQFGVSTDELALRRLETVFESRTVVGCRSRFLLEGGGSIHCLTKEVPKITEQRTPSLETA